MPSQKKPTLLKSVHLKARIAFAKRHIDKDCLFWSRVLWTDETKIELFGHNNVCLTCTVNRVSFKLFFRKIPSLL